MTTKTTARKRTKKSKEVKRREFADTVTVYSESMVSKPTWEYLDEGCNGILERGKQFVYKCGEWTVRMLTSGVYICARAGQKLILSVGKVAIKGIAILGAVAVLAWEGICSLLAVIFEGAKTAWEALVNFVSEASGKLVDLIKFKDKKEIAVEVTGNKIAVSDA
jgi:hypothetical protein